LCKQHEIETLTETIAKEPELSFSMMKEKFNEMYQNPIQQHTYTKQQEIEMSEAQKWLEEIYMDAWYREQLG
jgi:hypothetical protein